MSSDEHIGFDARPTGVADDVQRVAGIPVSTAAEAAQQAGRVRAAVDPDDPITQLDMHCKAFIEGANLSGHARMMALPKLAELIFWIRAGTAQP